MKQYFREDHTDHEWFELMKMFGEDLPTEYCDCFDEHGEYVEKYHDIFTTDIYRAHKKQPDLSRVIIVMNEDGQKYAPTDIKGKAVTFLNKGETIKQYFYITKRNFVHWLYEMGTDQEQESMIKGLGYEIVECLKDGKQFEFGYQDRLNDVIEMFPVHLVENFPNPHLWNVGDELKDLVEQDIDWIDWDNTEFLITENGEE